MAKAARGHHCHAAFQLVVRLGRHRVARHHLAHRRLLRIEPGEQHFYGAVTLGYDTDQDVAVDDQHRPDPVVAHPAQGFDHHVVGTNMDRGATLPGQSVFDGVHRVFSRGPCPSPPNLAHYAAINRGAWRVRLASLPMRYQAVDLFARLPRVRLWPLATFPLGCPLKGVKRRSSRSVVTSAYDPTATFLLLRD